MKPSVKELFDAIEEKIWIEDEGAWYRYELVYNDIEDNILMEITNRYGEFYDIIDVTEDYV